MNSSRKLSLGTNGLSTFWALAATDLLTRLNTAETGLSQESAKKIRLMAGLNRIKSNDEHQRWACFFVSSKALFLSF